IQALPDTSENKMIDDYEPKGEPPPAESEPFPDTADKTADNHQIQDPAVCNDGAKAASKAEADDLPALRKRILNLALPALVEQTLMTLVSMADMIMVGRLGPWAITSVGLSNQPTFV
ncbi:MAG TPA: hypothetical protein DCG91_04505, partial [Clostridiales bacterium UBA9857]|nr:hypothetical protein [Clostridiales bacterium UBA9857]